MLRMTTREQAIRDQCCMTPVDATWHEAGLPAYGAVLCLPCLQDRLGRQITLRDLDDCEANAWISRCDADIIGQP
jgi:hypothetical protein